MDPKSLFADTFARWSSGDLAGATAALIQIAETHRDWFAVLYDAKAPPGFTDMMVTVDPETDDWIVDRRNPTEIARLEEERRIWNRNNQRNPSPR